MRAITRISVCEIGSHWNRWLWQSPQSHFDTGTHQWQTICYEGDGEEQMQIDQVRHGNQTFGENQERLCRQHALRVPGRRELVPCDGLDGWRRS